MSFNDVDVAYCAGLFEGEGSVHAVDYYYVAGQKRARKTPQIKVQISMVDRGPLERFANTFGGRIHGPYHPKKYGHPDHHQEIWQYMLDSQAGAKEALTEMYPLLSERRRAKIDQVLGGESD